MRLNEANLKIAELYTFKFNSRVSDGETLYFTSSNAKILEYAPIAIKRGSVDFSMELEVPKLDITIANNSFKLKGDKINIIKAIDIGYFTNCYVTIEYYNVDTGERDVFWYGYIDKEIKYTRDEITFSVYSLLEKLNQQIPKITYQEQCNLKLYSTRCGLNKENYKFTGTISSKIDNKTFNVVYSGQTPSDDYLKYGYLVFTSGENSNNGQTISSNLIDNGNNVIVITKSMPFAVNVGDTFEAFAGCDKSGKSCAEKFNNYVNFLGFEYIPNPEVML
jgi:uncharacterized phage protein (TIGR02218 family)